MKYLIIGTGLSGLYCAYSLINKGIIDIEIIEKENRLGGRIETKYIDDSIIEFGSGSIAKVHHRFLKLIKELELENDLLISGNRDRFYIELSKTVNVTALKRNGFYTIIENLLNDLNDKNFYNLAKNYSLYRLIERKYNIEIAERMKHEFGYTADFINQNAIDGLNMFKFSFNKNMEYYKLKNGFELIIHKLYDFITKKGIKIKLNTELININKESDKYICLTNNEYILTENVILAIPTEKLKKIKFLDSINDFIDSVCSKSLMKIYAIFPLENGNHGLIR